MGGWEDCGWMIGGFGIGRIRKKWLVHVGAWGHVWKEEWLMNGLTTV